MMLGEGFQQPGLSIVAKPDLDDGWFMLAYELMAALMVAQIPKEARIVLFEVLSQIYGPSKLDSARLSPTEIAERTGLAKSNVARGVAFLLKNGIVRREGMDAYFFTKDYESWGEPGAPLVPPTLAGYAIRTPKRLKSVGEFKAPKSARKPVIETDNRSAILDVDNPLTDVDRLSKNERGVIEMDNAPPYRENREVVVAVEREPDTSTPSTPIPETPPAAWAQRPFRPDPAEVDRVKALVDGLDPMAYLGQKVENLKSAYPLDWIEKAFLKAAGQANHGRIAHYANTLLIAAWQAGRWDDPEPFEPRPARVFRAADAPRQPSPSRQARSMAALDAMDERLKETS